MWPVRPLACPEKTSPVFDRQPEVHRQLRSGRNWCCHGADSGLLLLLGYLTASFLPSPLPAVTVPWQSPGDLHGTVPGSAGPAPGPLNVKHAPVFEDPLTAEPALGLQGLRFIGLMVRRARGPPPRNLKPRSSQVGDFSDLGTLK